MIMAEGFVFELERRGFLQMGPWSPVAILDEPDVFKMLHRETLRAGTDVALACTYYAHPEKLRLINRADALEEINRRAIRICKQAVEEEGLQEETLIAGNICNTNIWEPGNKAREQEVRDIFKTCLGFAASEGVDFMIGETFIWTD
jgi:betaine-homocysteine S-methyltransferase